MKLVAWNCQGAYRKKAQRIARYAPDIAVVCECEHPDKLRFAQGIAAPKSHIWFGDSATKGLGVFSYTGAEFALDPSYDPSIRYCIPLKVSGPVNLNILAIWAMPHPERQHSYIGQVHRALRAYASFIQAQDTVLLGDWNSHSQWDHQFPNGNHTHAVAHLDAQGFVSLYHARYREPAGAETRPTFYLYRNRAKPYHLDYCFVPRTWLPRLRTFTVGTYKTWHTLSDHCPLFAEFG